MRREVIIAICAGLLIGVVIGFGIWRANKILSPKQNNKQGTPAIKETAGAGSIDLLISQPEDKAVLGEDRVTIAGKTNPSSTVVILANTGEMIFTSGKDGNFSQEVKLESGANEITVVAYSEEGDEARKTLTIVYSTEFPKR